MIVKKIFPLLLFCLLGSSLALQAQRSAERNTDDSFVDRLWFGGGLALSFSGNSTVNLFQFGISPIIGYKFTERFSAGPRANLLVNFYSFDTGGNKERAQPVDWAVGAFSRYKITAQIFAHGEYEYVNQAFALTSFDGLDIQRFEQNNVYLGGGYTTGGRSGFEILLLYNVNQDPRDTRNPLIVRAGFNYNF